MTSILDTIFGRKRVTIKENERALSFYKGEIRNILTPGEHVLDNRDEGLEVVRLDLKTPEFTSIYEKALFDKLPEQAARHLTLVRTSRNEIAIIERDRQIHAVLAPDRKLVVWTDAGPWTVTLVQTGDDLAVDPALMRRLGQARKTETMTVHPIVEGQAGLLFVDGAFSRKLDAGIHAFWNVGRMVQVKVIDLKRQPLDVAGQELLTKDRVTIRVNISAEYQVVDPVKAVTVVKDFSDAIYRALQNAFRKALGQLTLDQILETRATVDSETMAQVRTDIAGLGIEISSISLKDVILPGEMREILNQVVAAEKQAEANVIRRREETNATRALLNTAKVMADNPIMLRLKELEALETIAGKVERLTVHNGTEGLLNSLVRLRDS